MLNVLTVDHRSPNGHKRPQIEEMQAVNPTSVVGSPAPDFALCSTDGELVRLSDFRGQPVLIVFLATWGVHSRAALAELSALARTGAVAVLGISREPAVHLAAYAVEHDLNFPLLSDLGGEVEERYEVSCLPQTFAVDEAGTITGIHRGALEERALACWLVWRQRMPVRR
jgi:peroxiredoxin